MDCLPIISAERIRQDMEQITSRAQDPRAQRPIYGFSKLFSVSMPWITWLHIYDTPIPGVSLGYLALVLVVLFSLLNDKLEWKLYRRHAWLLCYYLLALLILPVAILLTGEINGLQIANRIVKQGILIYIVAFLAYRHVVWSYFKRSLQVISYIAAAAILIQFVMVLTTGRSVEFKIPFLSYCNEWSDTKDFSQIMAKTGRLTSIFIEPSHYTIFAIPYIIILLFEQTDGRTGSKVWQAIFFSFCSIISVSSLGTVCVVLIWAIYLIEAFRGKRMSKKKLFTMSLLIVLIPVFVKLFMSDDNISFSIMRLLPSYYNSTSVWSKITGGSPEFHALSPVLKLIGRGIGNISPIFMTGLYMVLNYTGFLGLAILAVWAAGILVRGTPMSRVSVLIFVIMFFIQPVFFAPTIITYGILSGGHK